MEDTDHRRGLSHYSEVGTEGSARYAAGAQNLGFSLHINEITKPSPSMQEEHNKCTKYMKSQAQTSLAYGSHSFIELLLVMWMKLPSPVVGVHVVTATK